MSDSQNDDNFDDLEISEEAYNKLLEDVSESKMALASVSAKVESAAHKLL